MARQRKQGADPDVTRVRQDYDEARQWHDRFATQCDLWYKAYRGILDRASEAADWHSKLHPAYLLQVVESSVANLVEDNLRFTCRARPKPDMDMQDLRSAATAHESLLRYQLDCQRFNEKQRQHALQAVVCGTSVLKVSWRRRVKEVTRQRDVSVPVAGLDGEEIGEDVTAFMPYSEDETVYDGPCLEVVDVRDFLWPESARSLDDAPWVIHRLWLTREQLEALEEEGVYENVSQLEGLEGQSDTSDERESTLMGLDRAKGRYEVLEHWTENRVVTVCQDVKLRAKDNPFWNPDQPKPFVVSSSRPDMFGVAGISDMEILADLQEAIWSLMNQRIDTLRLVSNAIVKIRRDLDDPDSIVFEPGAVWELDDPEQANVYSPDPTAAQVSLQAEAGLKGDVQNVTGGMPFSGGADSQTIDQETATGISIITSIAQRVLAHRKRQLLLGYERAADMMAWLNRQFVRQETWIEVAGKDGMRAWMSIQPRELQPDVAFDFGAGADSFVRQERRAEAQAKLQVAVQSAAVFAGTGQPLNLRAFMEDFLDSFDNFDYDRYFSASPQAAPLPGGGGAGAATPPGAPVPGQEGPGGVTSPLATDANSPSNQTSQSPVVMLQRALASQGPVQ